MKTFAKTISVIFHPSLLPSWLVAILLFAGEKSLQMDTGLRKLLLFIIFFVFTGLLPLLNVAVLKYLGYLKSFQMDDRRERNMPYMVGLIYYAGLFYLLFDKGIPLFYPALVITGFILILATLLINLSWKISAHAMGAGAFLGCLLMFARIYKTDIVPFISLAFFIGGMVAFSRLYLKKHSDKQVYIGYAAGLVIAIFFIPVSQLLIKFILYT